MDQVKEGVALKQIASEIKNTRPFKFTAKERAHRLRKAGLALLALADKIYKED